MSRVQGSTLVPAWFERGSNEVREWPNKAGLFGHSTRQQPTGRVAPLREPKARRYPAGMWSWIGIAVLYVFGIGFFRWLGGIGAASDAIQRWGRVTADRRRTTSPSP